VTLTPHPLLVPRSKIELSCTSTLPKGLCVLWMGETYEDLYSLLFSDVASLWSMTNVQLLEHVCFHKHAHFYSRMLLTD